MLLAGLALAACGGGDDPVFEPTPTGLTLERIGGFDPAAGGPPIVGAAEIPAYDAASKRLFVVNGANATVDVLDLSTATAPRRVGTLDFAGLAGAANSVAVHDGLVAVAVEAVPKTSPGAVAFFRASDLVRLATVTVGALPDMLVFTPDGSRVLVANEGEPNSYGRPDSVDPEGSVSIIEVNRNGSAVAPTVRTAGFAAFNPQIDALRTQGVRIYGPGATAAQDLEPEYITVSPDGRTAYVTLQENNAIATVDVASATITAVRALGLKDHRQAGMGLDPSDEDGGTDTNSGTPALRIGNWPVFGMYLPDAMASYQVGGQLYLVTANEGDARADWPGFNEEVRIRAHCPAGLDPAVFGADAARLLFDSNLGRLRVTTAPNGNDTGKNAAGQCTKLLAYGSRSFTIWRADDLSRVYDSGEDLERRTSALPNVAFNASHSDNALDSRSGSKGPEPEGVVLGHFGGKVFAFVGLERVGGVMVYDITNPRSPSFVTYLNTRNGTTGDLGPEGLLLIPAAQSPNGKPLLIVGNEQSGTTAVLQINLIY
ncbi:MAG: choice-of-anchor I family protein [Rubrivivax sp.]|nr:choice-of-anchor I family protein [Rubrivivax sp.]